MYDDLTPLGGTAPRIDARVVRHMMHETIDLLDLSAEHTHEACESTDAAMALTRIDWMLMAIFNWLTRQLRTDTVELDNPPLGDPISIIGIDQSALSDDLRGYAQQVDRLHARVRQLESLIEATQQIEATQAALMPVRSAQVLHIFGDPMPGQSAPNPVIASRQRLKTAFGGL